MKGFIVVCILLVTILVGLSAVPYLGKSEIGSVVEKLCVNDSHCVSVYRLSICAPDDSVNGLYAGMYEEERNVWREGSSTVCMKNLPQSKSACVDYQCTLTGAVVHR